MNTYQSITPSRGTVKTLQTLNILGFILMVTLNFLANWLPLNGKTTGELSDNYPNLFVPAGATFSIWGVIYLLLLAFTVYQASTLFSTRRSTVHSVVSQISIWFFCSSVMNALWIIAWHYELLPVSVAIMWLLLLSLILVNFGLYNINEVLPVKERLLVKAPFGIYLGWISVATIANMTAWLTGIQWNSGLEQDSWAVIMIIVGGLIALYAAFRLSNAFLPLAVVWAFLGIVFKRMDQEPVHYSIVLVAVVMALVLFISSMVLLGREFKKPVAGVHQPSPLYN